MNAKNGELAIAKFDSGNKNKRWKKRICFVTGRNKSQTKFIWWEHNANHTIMYSSDLPKGRVVRAVVKTKSRHLILNGEFYKLTMDDVEPGTADNRNKETYKTSDIKLGGCYHTGKAYCLGYRINHKEIELANKLFTCLDGGVEGGAQAALHQHRENFDHTADIPNFIVELEVVKIIDEDTGNAGCDNCGTHDREDDQTLCLDCLDKGICDGCLNIAENCDCLDAYDYNDDDEDIYDNCLICCEKNSCCICNKDDHFDDDGYCNRCEEICTDCECDDICDIDGCWCNDRHLENGYMADFDLNDENIDKTFRPMNAFCRARWLQSCR